MRRRSPRPRVAWGGGQSSLALSRVVALVYRPRCYVSSVCECPCCCVLDCVVSSCVDRRCDKDRPVSSTHPAPDRVIGIVVVAS